MTFNRDSDRDVIHKKWYFGKSLIEVMLSPNGMNVKHINHNFGFIEFEKRNEFVNNDNECDCNVQSDLFNCKLHN